MAPITAQAIAQGAQALFQATFTVDDLLVKVDILAQAEAGWHLIEVKSSAKYKPEEHLPDIAFQVYVLQRAGLNVIQASLMHLNSACRYPDLADLFALTDVTDDVRSFLPRVEKDVAAMRQIILGDEAPPHSIGRYCSKPQECPFYSHCWRDIDGWTIYDIPYLKRPQEQQLEEKGIRYVADIPPEFVLTDKRANAFVDLVNQQQISIDGDAIRAELATLSYPLYFFDFETIDYAIPVFDGCKPYQQVPFQYSCHILDADGSLTHRDYLHTTKDDPRQALVEALLADIGQAGSLIAYNISFERAVIRHLAEQFPTYADRLMHMADRLWDQLAIFRKHYRHYEFGGSDSLKAVLPVIVPALRYTDLAVQDGVQAQEAWEELVNGADSAESERLIQQLRAYCHLDTLAMVELHRALQAL